MPTTFFSDNDSGTLADLLKAVGLAEVLQTWLLRHTGRAAHITLRDCGGWYQIELPTPLAMEDTLNIVPFSAGRGQMLVSAKQLEKAAKTGTNLQGFDYDGERAKSTAYFAQRKKLSAADQKKFAQHPEAEEFAGLLALTPHRDLSLYTCVNHFRIAEVYNTFCTQWLGSERHPFAENLRLLLTIFGQYPNSIEAAAQEWKATSKAINAEDDGSSTLLQIVNPSTGKGGNAPKANGLGIGNLDGFWLNEYLKLVGFFTVATPITIKGVKDRKTYVLRPHLVELDALRQIMMDFRETFYANSAIKSDILAALRFTQTVVTYCGNAIRDRTTVDPLFALFGGQAPPITDIAGGFDVAFYKDMGSAFATMNMATINLPDWLAPINNEADAQAAQNLLEEHMTVVRSIQTSRGDEGSDEFELLRRYRDFLSGHDTLRFFECAAHFGDYYLGHKHRNQWVAQFTTEGMDILMAQSTDDKDKLLPIISDEGFKAIAKAIRQATVLAQYHAARKQGNYVFDVRYGLGQELLRASAYPDNFIAALGAFLQSFNAENARIDERITKGALANLPQNRRASVRTTHIDAIVALVDKHGSDVVCKLLVAYGYARDPQTPRDEAPPEEHLAEITENDGE